MRRETCLLLSCCVLGMRRASSLPKWSSLGPWRQESSQDSWAVSTFPREKQRQDRGLDVFTQGEGECAMAYYLQCTMYCVMFTADDCLGPGHGRDFPSQPTTLGCHGFRVRYPMLCPDARKHACARHAEVSSRWPRDMTCYMVWCGQLDVICALL